MYDSLILCCTGNIPNSHQKVWCMRSCAFLSLCQDHSWKQLKRSSQKLILSLEHRNVFASISDVVIPIVYLWQRHIFLLTLALIQPLHVTLEVDRSFQYLQTWLTTSAVIVTACYFHAPAKRNPKLRRSLRTDQQSEWLCNIAVRTDNFSAIDLCALVIW